MIIQILTISVEKWCKNVNKSLPKKINNFFFSLFFFFIMVKYLVQSTIKILVLKT